MREHHLPRRGRIAVVAVFYAVLGLSLFREGAREIIAGAPFYAVLGYALAAGLVNHVRTRADSRGIAVACGPLPVAPASAPVQRAEVAKVYVRHAVMPSRTGGVPYLVAGVQRRDGRWYDVSQPFLDDDAVWREARQLAAALQWPDPVEELWGMPPRRDWREMRMVWYWTGAVLASVGWGCLAPFVAP